MNGKLLLVLLGGACLMTAHTYALSEETDEQEGEGKKEEAPVDQQEEASGEEEKDGEKEDDVAPFACNLKFKRVGCYADKGNKERPLRSFIMTDADLGSATKKGDLPKGDKFNGELPKFACKCANEAINEGNAVFGLQNLAECWTGPDDSKYDKDGSSDQCVSFDYEKCEESAELCAGKKGANFVYYVDSEDHTKSKAEIKKEFAEYNKKVAKWRKEQVKKAADKKKKAKKAKKSKKAKKE